MDKEDRYSNYFKERYGYSFSKQDLFNYQNWFQAQWKYIVKFAPLQKVKSLVELGSGIGGFYSFLSQEIDYLGIELDEKAVKFAQELFPKAKFTAAKFEDLDESRKYAAASAFEVLEHVDNPIFVIQKLWRILEQDGVFVGTSPYPFARNVLCDKTHRFVLHPENWRQLFLQAGFKKVIVKPMTFIPFLWRIHPALNIRLPFYLNVKNFVSTTLIIAYR